MRRARRPLPYPRTYNPAPFSPIAGGQSVIPSGARVYKFSHFEGGAGTEWTKAAGEALVDEPTKLHGTQSMKLTSVNDVSAVAMKTGTWDMSTGWTNDRIYFSFWVDDITKFKDTGAIQLYFSPIANDSRYWTKTLTTSAAGMSNGWNVICITRASCTSINSATAEDWAAVIRVRIRIRAAADATINMYLDGLYQVSGDLPKAIVCLTFDDGWLTQHTNAKPLMDQYGFPGVAAPITSHIGSTGYMTQGQLHDLRRAGWEIGNHGHLHPADPYYLTEGFDYDTDIRRGFDILTDAGLEPVDYFVYPGGAYDAGVLAATARHHTYARGIYNSGGERTAQFFPAPLIIKASGPLTAAAMATNVDAAVAAKSVYVQITHKVETNAGSLIFPTAEFETAMDHLKTHVDAGELEVLNWTDTLKRMRGEAV